jgi:hypothetical protein
LREDRGKLIGGQVIDADHLNALHGDLGTGLAAARIWRLPSFQETTEVLTEVRRVPMIEEEEAMRSVRERGVKLNCQVHYLICESRSQADLVKGMSRNFFKEHSMKTQDRSTKLHHVNPTLAAGSGHFHDQTGARLRHSSIVRSVEYAHQITHLQRYVAIRLFHIHQGLFEEKGMAATARKAEWNNCPHPQAAKKL